MNLLALVLIIISAGFHATWNFLSKAGTPSRGYFLLTTIAATILTFPFALFGPVDYLALPPKFWLFVFFSVLCELAYILSLANGYRKAEISFFYPMARSLPVLFTFVISSAAGIGKNLSAAAMVGMVLVTAGCLVMPIRKFSDIKLKDYFNSTMPYILLGAAGTTGYTIFDSLACNYLYATGANKSLVALGYLGVIEAGILLGSLVIVGISSKERAIALQLRRDISPYLAGTFSVAAYVLVLIAMGLVTNVSFIQAFRQLSLPIGVALGVIILKEKITLPKAIGVTLLLAGLMLTAI